MDREVVVRSSRLALTSWLPADVDGLFLIHADPETMRFVRHGRPETREETAALVGQYIAEHARRGWTKWRIADQDDQVIGRAGFGPEGAGRELGYTLRRDRWGQGLATEIATALVRWHRDHAPAVPLFAYAAVENAPSQRVLAKVGFQFVGTEGRHGEPCRIFRLPDVTPVA